MKKINVIGVSIIAVTFGGCASEPMRDVTYLPKATSPQPTQYYNSKGEIYNPSGTPKKREYQAPKILKVEPAGQPQPVYQQPQVIYQQPQPVYQQPQVIYQQPQPVYQQPQVIYQQPQPVYRNQQQGYQTRANIGGAILGGAVGGVLGNELTRESYYGRRGGYYRQASHGNLAVVGLGAAVGTMAGSGCQTNGGTVVGALVGGAIGQAIGKGSGRAVATAIGSGAGAVVGSGC